jgi:DNA-binding XRE family transcriptional regulator
MTQTITSPFVFEPRTTASSPPTEAGGSSLRAKLYVVAVPESTVELPEGFKRIGDYVAELEATPEGAAGMREARARLGRVIQDSGPPTLRSMRLALGLSQTQLAAKVGTSQPQIARIEAGRPDPTYDTFVRIAGALEAAVTDVVAAFGESRKAVSGQ